MAYLVYTPSETGLGRLSVFRTGAASNVKPRLTILGSVDVVIEAYRRNSKLGYCATIVETSKYVTADMVRVSYIGADGEYYHDVSIHCPAEGVSASVEASTNWGFEYIKSQQ